MKTKRISTIVIGLFLVFSFTSCELLENFDFASLFDGTGSTDIFGGKQLEAEDAKIEMEAASSEVADTKDFMLECTGFATMNYFLDLEAGISFKSGAKSALIFNKEILMEKVFRMSDSDNTLKSTNEDEEEMYGIWEYDFDEEEFVKTGESNSYKKYKFPATESDFSKRKLTAELTMDDLEYVTISSVDEVAGYSTPEDYPTNAEIILKVNNVTELTGEYIAKYNDTGKPTSIKGSMESCEYVLTMNFSGSGTEYTSTLSFKLGNELKLGYDMKIKYTKGLEDVESIKGTVTTSPVKYDCDIKIKSILDEIDKADENETDPDIDVINSNFKIEVIQIDQDAIIGTVEFVEEEDPDYEDETETNIVIVYKDGSTQLLSEVFPFLDE